MTTLPSMGLTLPTRGSGGAGAWGDTLDADLALLDAHDHSSGKGARITPSGININADLPFSALWAPTQLHRVQFSAIAVSSLTGSQRKSLFVSDGTGGLVSNELYYLTNAGASVQITSGSTLNVGTFAGTIGGDYGGVGAQLNYTDSSKTYDFKESTADSHGWARVQCGGIRLIEFNTTETFFVAHIAPTALAGSYTVTWPTALPASTNPMFIDNTGQVSFPSAPTFPGLVTLSAGATAAANQHITVSGTGEYKHGNFTQALPANMGTAITGTFATGANGDVTCSVAGTWVVPVPLLTGDRVQSVTLGVIGDGAVDLTVNVVYVSKTAGTSTKATVSITNAPASWNDSTATAGSPVALAAGEVCVITIAPNSSGSVFNNIRVVYDRP